MKCIKNIDYYLNNSAVTTKISAANEKYYRIIIDNL